MTAFYLVQRLTLHEATGEGSDFDDVFACQYMGSAEFEWGALPAALKRLRAIPRRHLRVTVAEVTRAGLTRAVCLVGDRRLAAAQADALSSWLDADQPWSKESTYLPEHFAGQVPSWQQHTDAWWSLDSDVIVTLDASVAERVLVAVRGKAVRRAGRGARALAAVRGG